MTFDPTSLQSFSFLGLALVFLGGLLTSLGPCNIATIPLIVGYVGGSQNLSRGRSFALSLAFAIGFRNAEAQLSAWSLAEEDSLPILRVDFSRRPDLAQQYGVNRAPALLLLDALGQVVWKQDVGLSDEAPLDLEQANAQLEALLSKEAR
jgi:hypothetical protein